MSSTGRFAEVLLPVPVSTSYRYLVPDALAARAQPGARVVVPVRRRRLIGIVTGHTDKAPPKAAQAIVGAPDEAPALSPALLELGRWMSGYYGVPHGLALRALLPGALWTPTPKGGASPASERVIRLAGALPSLLERERAFARSPKRRAAYETLEALGGAAPVRHLVTQMKLSEAALAGLVRQGLARIEQAARERDPFADLAVPPPPQLTDDQRRVVTEILTGPPTIPALIQGVTGSGKTLVYLEAVRDLVDSGRGAILLVPEIALTPQTVARVRGVFGDLVAVLHSGLSDGERADAWRALRRGDKRVAVGARSAVFAPVQRLAAIVVDEEHEPSYKQNAAPRYHARDVAAVRARLEGARLVLGSATPSLETLHHVKTGTIRRHVLPQRIGARPLPPVQVVDLRSAPRAADSANSAVPWTEALDDLVREALEHRQQVILLLNRRGFATFLQCPNCGDVRQCPRCAIALTVHATPAPSRLKCHYCGHEEPVPEQCRVCGHAVQRMRGLGTQQLEHFVSRRFPAARIARMDLDTTSTKWGHHRILDRVGRREVDILLGTQMIAKGLDFPEVTVVGVVDADTALHFPDFRAAERTFQLIAQVAGRAGRGPAGGRVVVQTRAPDHHAIRAAAAHSVEQFAAVELPLREPPGPPYPPTVGLVRFVAFGATEAGAARRAGRLAEWLRRVNSGQLEDALTVLGPAPCPISRLQGRWRWHVLARSTDAGALGRVLRTWRSVESGGVGIVVDRDPVSLL